MRILDTNGNEVQNPDLTLGYLTQDRILIAHHDAVEPVQGRYHYEYDEGGANLRQVIDVESVAGHEAYDEYEDIQRYILYTPEEYENMHKNDNVPTAEERIATLESSVSDLTMLLGQMFAAISGTGEAAATTTEVTE